MDQPSEPRGHEPLTDEQIIAATVGEIRVHVGPIQLVDYDPSWPERFARQAERIAAALGERALMIGHVGSTAVPGLPAKPTIDILLVVANSADEETYVPALEAAGYVLRIREPDLDEHRMFRDPERTTQVHVLSEGCPEIERYLLFRDRLRTNQEDRELYERTKRELAQREWRYVQNYADAKGDVIEGIIDRARAEAHRIGAVNDRGSILPMRIVFAGGGEAEDERPLLKVFGQWVGKRHLLTFRSPRSRRTSRSSNGSGPHFIPAA
jgi:GrpB-like predicted nucleotidyltransferase (UPF0157 family)